MKESDNDIQSYNASLRFLPFSNDTGEEIPAHGLFELEGSDEFGFTALKPRTDSCFCFLNGPVPIPDGKKGQAYAGLEGLIIATDGAAAAGEDWGAEAGSWLAVSGKKGFVAMADGEGGFVYARRLMPGATSDGDVYVKVTGLAVSIGGDDYYPGELSTFDSSTYSWSESETVYLTGLPDTPPGLFSTDQRYRAAYNSTITVTSVDYPIYIATGDADEFSAGNPYPGLVGTGQQRWTGVKIFRSQTLFRDSDTDATRHQVSVDATHGGGSLAQVYLSTPAAAGTSGSVKVVTQAGTSSQIVTTFDGMSVSIFANSSQTYVGQDYGGKVTFGAAYLTSHGISSVVEASGLFTTNYMTNDGVSDVAGVSGTFDKTNTVTVVNGLITNIA